MLGSAWLGEEEAGEEALRALFEPGVAPALAIWPVPRRVGRVAENDAALLERNDSAEPVLGLDDMPPDAAQEGTSGTRPCPAGARQSGW